MRCGLEPYKDYRVYTFDVTEVPISSTWGSLYVSSSQKLTISTEGDLTQKKVIVTFNNKSGQARTAFMSVDNIIADAVYCSFARGTSGSVSGTFVVVVYA